MIHVSVTGTLQHQHVNFKPGACVLLRGLSVAAELNGTIGKVVGTCASGRYEIALGGNGNKALGGENLVAACTTTTAKVLSSALTLKLDIKKVTQTLRIPGISVHSVLEENWRASASSGAARGIRSESANAWNESI